MAFSSMTARAASYVVTAANDWNVMVSNFDAIWVGTTGGDMDYYSSATAKTRMAIGAAGTFLRSAGSVPNWGSLVTARQGGNATNWQIAGTTSYVPTNPIIQMGVAEITTNAGTGLGNVAVTYPNAFTNRPIVLISVGGSSTGNIVSTFSDDATTGFTARVFKTDLGAVTIQVNWMAVGI